MTCKIGLRRSASLTTYDARRGNDEPNQSLGYRPNKEFGEDACEGDVSTRYITTQGIRWTVLNGDTFFSVRRVMGLT